MAISKELKGNNLCNTSCVEKNQIIYPKNSINDVLMSEEGTTSLYSWIMGGLSSQNNTEPTIQTSLKEWLQTYYTEGIIEVIPKASSSVLGGIRVGNYLTIDPQSGVLSVNKPSLGIPNIPENWNAEDWTANESYVGGIKTNGVLDISSITGEATEEGNTYISILNEDLIGEFNNTYYITPLIKINCDEVENDTNKAVVCIPVKLMEYDYIRNAPSFNLQNRTITINNNTISIPNSAVSYSGNYSDLRNIPVVVSENRKFEKNHTIGIADFDTDRSLHDFAYIGEILENDLSTCRGNNCEVTIDIIGDLNADCIEDFPNLIIIQEDIVQQYLSDYLNPTKLVINFEFTVDSQIQQPQITSDFLYIVPSQGSGNYFQASVEGSRDFISIDDTKVTFTCSSSRKHVLTFEYMITKATLNPNETTVTYSTKWKYKVEDLHINISNLLQEETPA